jgi:opacity protein-like surface antigen
MVKHLAIMSITALMLHADGYTNTQGAYYISGKAGVSSMAYHDETFVNPRINDKASGNSDQTGTLFSVAVGRKYHEMPVRTELEYTKTSEETFTSQWNPFPTFDQKVSVKSERMMANFIYDFEEVDVFTPYVGVGLGVAKNSADAVQVGSGNFASKDKTNFAFSLQTGITKQVSDNFDLEVGYKYVNAGEFETGKSQFAPNDENFEGDLIQHDVTFGVRYNFR